LLLRGKLLRLLLLLLELLEVKVKVLSVELFVEGGLGVEPSSIENLSSGSTSLVGKRPSSGLVVSLGSNGPLSLDNSSLVSNDSSVSFLLQLELRTLCDRDSRGTNRTSKVGSESGAVVGRVRNDLQLARLIQKAIFAFYISLFVSGL